MTRTDAPEAGAATREWTFLGLHVTELSDREDHVVVARATVPAGASPPLHVHAHLDDSFYVLDGTMVVRCGEDVTVATTGSWVPFPAAVPHTFRVIGAPATVLMVHADDSFLQAVRTIGHPSVEDGLPPTTDGPDIDELDRMFAEQDITVVGPPMEADEAELWMARLSSRTD